MALAEEQEREPTSTLPKPASTLPVKVAMAMAEVAKLNAHLSTLLGVAPAHPAPTTQELLERIGAECVEMRRHALKMELRRATSPGLEKKLYTTGLDAQGGINARIKIDSELLFAAILVVQPTTTLDTINDLLCATTFSLSNWITVRTHVITDQHCLLAAD